jgi:hypothetical protein
MARGHMPRAIYCRRTGMGYALRAGISFCEVSERLLFLDTWMTAISVSSRVWNRVFAR